MGLALQRHRSSPDRNQAPQILFPVPAFDRTMAAPSALVLKCEVCGAEVPHRVLRGKIGGKDEIVFEGTVKCRNSGRVSTVVTRQRTVRQGRVRADNIIRMYGRIVRERFSR